MTNEQAIFYLKMDRELKIDAMSSPEVAKKTCTVIAYDKGIEALEKQIPKKPSETDKARCIHCACVVKRDERFCKNCGQALLWKSEDKGNEIF